MPLFKGTGAALAEYTVMADDTEQAMDFIFDAVKEDFTSADAYEVSNIVEVKQ